MCEALRARQRKKLLKHLVRRVSRGIGHFRMIEEGSRVLVGLSGGKDSLVLVDLLAAFKKQSPFHFDLEVIFLDHGFPGFPDELLPRHMDTVDLPFTTIHQDIWKTLQEKCPDGKKMCTLCSRLRRGALYAHASAHGFTHLALGHHMDDMVETLFLNMFYGASLKGMPPRLTTRGGEITLIRPMLYVAEEEIARYIRLSGYETAPGDLCGVGENEKRREIKEMLKAWRKEHPGRVERVLASMGHVVPSHLADRDLYDFSRGESV